MTIDIHIEFQKLLTNLERPKWRPSTDKNFQTDKIKINTNLLPYSHIKTIRGPMYQKKFYNNTIYIFNSSKCG